jgi:hypothetical protein
MGSDAQPGNSAPQMGDFPTAHPRATWDECIEFADR